MPPTLTYYLAALVAAGLVIAFFVLYAQAIYQTWTSKDDTPVFANSYVYVATIFAGLVGGVAAMMFNEKLPEDPQAKAVLAAAKDDDAMPVRTPSASGPQAGLTALLRSLTSRENLLAVVSTTYVLAYFIIGIAAIWAWVKKGDKTPDLVKNLALISIGLFVAIARKFIEVPASA